MGNPNLPEIIYLYKSPFGMGNDILWSAERWYDGDVKYVRADEVEKLEARLRRVEGAARELDEAMTAWCDSIQYEDGYAENRAWEAMEDAQKKLREVLDDPQD